MALGAVVNWPHPALRCAEESYSVVLGSGVSLADASSSDAVLAWPFPFPGSEAVLKHAAEQCACAGRTGASPEAPLAALMSVVPGFGFSSAQEPARRPGSCFIPSQRS